jgi:hypothetical protein
MPSLHAYGYGGRRSEIHGCAPAEDSTPIFRLVNLLTCPRIMRPDSDPGDGLGKWDREFESVSLQRRVCKLSVPA